MKKNNFINYTNLLVKSIFLVFFLLFTASVSSFAQPYIQIEADFTVNPDGVLQMKAYSDAACTTPTTFSGTVNYRTKSVIGCELTEVYDTHVLTTAEFNSAGFLYGGYLDPETIRYCEDVGGHLEDLVNIYNSILTGSGYTVASTPVVYIY